MGLVTQGNCVLGSELFRSYLLVTHQLHHPSLTPSLFPTPILCFLLWSVISLLDHNYDKITVRLSSSSVKISWAFAKIAKSSIQHHSKLFWAGKMSKSVSLEPYGQVCSVHGNETLSNIYTSPTYHNLHVSVMLKGVWKLVFNCTLIKASILCYSLWPLIAPAVSVVE